MHHVGVARPLSPDVRCGHPGFRSLDAALAFAILASLGQQRRSIGTGNLSATLGILEKPDLMSQANTYERFAPVEREIVVRDEAYRFWCPPDVDALIDEEAFRRDERIPYWANVWESAVVLAEELVLMEGNGRRLLELGCGLGLPAIAAARHGFKVTASDYEEDALEGVRYNAARNAAAALAVRLIDWRQPPDDLGRFELVVAADVLYEKHHAVALAGMLARTLADGGVALVADPGRARAVEFEPACRAAGLAVEKQPARRPLGAIDGPAIDVYRVTRGR
jgi:predicted nicotinamide N-methyase